MQTKVSSLKELLEYEEPKTELDISPVITRPNPFLFKRTLFESSDSKKTKKKNEIKSKLDLDIN